MRIETVDSGLVQSAIFFGTENPSNDAIAQANSVLARPQDRYRVTARSLAS